MAKYKKTAKSSSSKRQSGGKKAPTQQKIKEHRLSLARQIAPYLLILLSLLMAIALFTGQGEDPGIVMKWVYNLMTGLFGIGAFLVPAFLFYAAVSDFIDKNDGRIFSFRFISAICSAVLISVFAEIISPASEFKIGVLWTRGTMRLGGGVIGGSIGELSLICFKTVGSAVLVGALLLLSVMLTAGLTPKYLFKLISVKWKEAQERREKETEERAAYEDSFEEEDDGYVHPEEELALPPVDPRTGEVFEKPALRKKGARKKFDTDVPLDDDEPEEAYTEEDTESPEEKQARINEATFAEVMRRSEKTKPRELLEAERALFIDEDTVSPEAKAIPTEEKVAPVSEEAEGFEILDKLALEYEQKKKATLNVERETVSQAESAPQQIAMDIPKPAYKYPPIEYLTEDPGSTATDIRAEYQENAAKLVSVLSSFNVKTKIVGVSRGPTITRYELLPEAGTRVRSISNLVDDIALNLATSGVRIEAPIPGKAAVGIEVPNKQAETVYLRTLISSRQFNSSKSKLTTALGEDVAGEPIIMDIAKMPHLLIAGATGMGKSVCINCLLMSLLYKATPDEVKLILIDPKKVEFGIYNGLPHLLVPVVSDPKKAAGSLNWAVNEMERRFGLIESVGVRDIASYNKLIAEDPQREYMPQIVIVIDELADLMATAANDVETSIARLAAKARAAGMHLVIGTQRPSVDVITGVIKANIPSRIAFTVASQVDSRTIIDRSGAESLIGRGDMLYSPVGAAKPMRVQGAFVSEKEVDAVVRFIKEQTMAGENTYNDEVMKEIEAQAAMCGNKKGSAPIGDGEEGADAGDPLVPRAMEVAFESGKISTSLLQRRLSIGYGRAAKIIDHMEKAGYVSAPEGQKPREVLISRDQFMELQVKNEEL